MWAFWVAVWLFRILFGKLLYLQPNLSASARERSFKLGLDCLLHAALHLICNWLLTLTACCVKVSTVFSTSLVYCFSFMCLLPGQGFVYNTHIHSLLHHLSFLTCISRIYSLQVHYKRQCFFKNSHACSGVDAKQQSFFFPFFCNLLVKGAPSHIHCIIYVLGVIWVSCLCGTHSRRRSVHVFRRHIGSRTGLLSLKSFVH